MSDKRLKLGRRGEELAARYLQNLGYSILKNNFRCYYGEIDLIGQEGNTLAFIEVKTRSSLAFGSPAAAVTPGKQRKIFQVAQYYLSQHPCNNDIRFDVVSVLVSPHTQPEIELIRNAFDFSD